MEKGKDSHIISINDANTGCSSCDPPSSSSVNSEQIDAIYFHEVNRSEDLLSSALSDNNNDDTVCDIEEIEEESVSTATQTIEMPSTTNQDAFSYSSLPSLNSIVCRICHNGENPDKLVSPCNCRGTLAYVHIYCLERWIGTSRCTTCELCHFEYHTEQTLRYSCLQSLRIYYSRHISRRTLQEDCQMFSMLTLVAFGIIGTLLVGLQYYLLQGNFWGMGKIWNKGWLLFFLFTTLAVYMINIYLLAKSQLIPWYRWWQSARDIKLILENRHPHLLQHIQKLQQEQAEVQSLSMVTHPPNDVDHQRLAEINDFGITNAVNRTGPAVTRYQDALSISDPIELATVAPPSTPILTETIAPASAPLTAIGERTNENLKEEARKIYASIENE